MPTGAPANRPTPAAKTRARRLAPHELDASGYDAVLRRFVVPGGVRYGALRSDSQSRLALHAFLEAAAGMSERAPLSSWLNVYNALVIEAVLQRYPTGSVMDDKGFFKARRHRIAGELRSLDDIEHGVIRKRFPDARVHMALNCGAVSCPALANRAFVQATLDKKLEALSRAVVNDPSHVALRDGQIRISSIFFWFETDFVRDAGSTRAWLLRYAEGELEQGLRAGVPLSERSYDWKLNRAP